MSEEIKREKSLTMTMLMTPDKANFLRKKCSWWRDIKNA